MSRLLLVALLLGTVGCAKPIARHQYKHVDLHFECSKRSADRFESTTVSGWPPVSNSSRFERGEVMCRAGFSARFDYVPKNPRHAD